MRRVITSNAQATSCYFRSMVEAPYRKALLKITERCNLFCVHCFVSAGDYGDVMQIEDIIQLLIPRLRRCRVISATLTGGEPFVHPHVMDVVRSLRAADIRVGICTNATQTTEQQMDELVKIGEVHLNVSLDGFRPESHGRFRGDKDSFYKTIETIRQFSTRKLLQGLLVTPNNLAEAREYSELCDFAIKYGASYVLMNPLSSMGRGVKSKNKLGSTETRMIEIRKLTDTFRDQLEIVNIRFPNEQHLPLASCEAGNIIYVFTHGEVTICPYLVFATKTPQSKHRPEEFIVGNIFNDADIAERLDAYKFHERYRVGDNPTCQWCLLNSRCGKGCPAAIIAAGDKIGLVDQEACPVTNPIK